MAGQDSRARPLLPVRKARRGAYLMDDGQHIIRTEWDGPAGGRRYLWEVYTPDRYGGVVGRVGSPTRTLREMRQQLYEMVNS